MDLSPSIKLDMYRAMLLSRRLDERAWALHREKKISFHMSAIGHEAAQVGAAFALQHGSDWVAPYPRDLALLLGLGMTAEDYIRMLMGRPGAAGSGGRGMPGCWNLPSANVISISGVAASHLPHAVGIALAMRNAGKPAAVLASCGEGATSMGEWYEAVNWAAAQRLPLVFLVQNNGFAISTRQKRQMLRSPSHKASGMGLPAQKVDGTDAFKVYEALDSMLQEARAGNGPGLVEARVVRIPPHSSDDDDRSYRTRAEVEEARRHDPLPHLRKQLMRAGVLTEEIAETLEAQVLQEIEDALLRAESLPLPDPENEASAVYAPLTELSGSDLVLPASERDLTLLDALHDALDREMEADERVVLLGMDIGVKGGIFRATRGLLEKYGPERVIDAPLSGAALVGVGIGMALYGCKPVCEVQFADFILPAFNQVVNEAAKIYYRSAGAWRVPLVIRAPYGGGIGGGLYHSQSVEAFFTHVPGLKVMVPSDPQNAAGLLHRALQDPNPVLFLEPKRGYRRLVSGVAPGEDGDQAADACVTRVGEDISVICYGMMHTFVVEAAEKLEEEGISVEVIDLRLLYPLSLESLLESVKKTGKVLIVHEDTLSGGFGAEVAARVADQGFFYLDAPVRRLAGPDVPGVPFSPRLQDWFMLDREKIMDAIRSLVQSDPEI